eukprot:TRINITY_DN6383_c0_g1_i2.p1 TRINITY_DN6383_c0_g1~~TRINITY_DN6383_c0_g1_i2.p1  ORF type:complete len:216 (+),score=62.67 TRINITY_DN6383_c0_g1_i2:45-692(+)
MDYTGSSFEYASTPPSPTYEGKSTALVIIDMQRGFLHPTYWGGKRNNPHLEEVCLRLLNKYRDQKWPIIHVHHHSNTPGSPLSPNLPDPSGNTGYSEVDALEGFEPRGAEIKVIKTVNSSFIGTNLTGILAQMGVKDLILVGLTANHCVNTTARMAGNLGYSAVVVGDGVACFPRLAWDGKGEIDADTVQHIALSTIHNEFCTVMGSEELLNLLH